MRDSNPGRGDRSPIAALTEERLTRSSAAPLNLAGSPHPVGIAGPKGGRRGGEPLAHHGDHFSDWDFQRLESEKIDPFTAKGLGDLRRNAQQSLMIDGGECDTRAMKPWLYFAGG